MTVRRRLVGILIASTMTASLGVGLSPPAQAADIAPSPLVTDPLVATAPLQDLSASTALEQTYTADHATVTSTRTLDLSTQSVENTSAPSFDALDLGTVNLTTGSGGSSTASGCRRVTVRNVAHSWLHVALYHYNIWTDWCWRRSTQTVYSVTTGWNITNVKETMFWQRQLAVDRGFYDYGANDGHPQSAYLHHRQGYFTNCFVVVQGCLAFYPDTRLRAYYNGTWSWQTTR